MTRCSLWTWDLKATLRRLVAAQVACTAAIPAAGRMALKSVRLRHHLSVLLKNVCSIDAATVYVLSRLMTQCAVAKCAEQSRRESKIDSDLLEIPYEELELDKKIGRGSFGETDAFHN